MRRRDSGASGDEDADVLYDCTGPWRGGAGRGRSEGSGLGWSVNSPTSLRFFFVLYRWLEKSLGPRLSPVRSGVGRHFSRPLKLSGGAKTLGSFGEVSLRRVVLLITRILGGGDGPADTTRAGLESFQFNTWFRVSLGDH